jgi:hypothetical protein
MPFPKGARPLTAHEDAIMQWVRVNRPDLIDRIDECMDNHGLALLMSIAFYAGREFQILNPTVLTPVLDDAEYVPITKKR